jgi:MFS transporter, PPP family, 3-phenylpropionic acid transporter
MKREIRAGTSVRALFALIGVCIAALSPFLALLLRDRGFDPSQIGVVFSAMAATWMIANPVWGHAADVWIGRVRALRIAALGAAAMGVVFFLPAQRMLVVLPVVIVLAAFHGGVVPIGDAIALDHLGPDDVRDYGLIRLWSSLAFGVAAIAFGALYTIAGIGLVPLMYAAAMATLAAWSTTMTRDVPARVPSGERFGSVGAAFRASPRLAPLLVGMLLWGIGFAAAWSFLPLRIVGRGGGPFLVGIAAASGAFVEVPVMRKSKWFTGRFSHRGVYVLGCVIYASVFVAWAFVKDPVVIAVLNGFEGVGFALLYVSGVMVVGKLVPKHLQATGQSMMQMVGQGLGPVLGASIGGVIYGRSGPRALFLVAAASTLLAAMVIWFTLSPPAFSERNDARAETGD